MAEEESTKRPAGEDEPREDAEATREEDDATAEDQASKHTSGESTDATGEDGAAASRDEDDQSDGGATAEQEGVEDISDTPAPSIGPGSVVKREPVEVRLARHDQSDVDAMGQDKRRQVVGKTYGPTLARQAALYGIFLVIVAAIAFGVKIAVDHFDQPPKHFAAKAPWAQPGVKQTPPKPLQ